ncbi:oligoendopeptidase F [Enterococcus sp. PF1-24]|uniref:M3 family oligoendopeptidase n=1 Tax=unclassified Enterococcus TaxID=2608891 RepID=UPI002475B2E0|nr:MULTISPECIES: M3 family oligoendopeptidase [unclassified Enterococcus]MDH6363930.1 oligoendopeptidase F [Enterococcus sp. PFB1-1]MDH6401031.1 oligoendopeptidase F [Enterococcus sp. PF1-24]
MTIAINWDLESIFAGGSESSALLSRMEALQAEITAWQTLVKNYQGNSIADLQTILQQQGKLTNGFSQCATFITALTSANTADTKAIALQNKLYALLPEIKSVETTFSKKLAEISDSDWQVICQNIEIQPVAFRLTEIRKEGRQLLSENEENIIHTLALDGLNAWSSHYDTLVATIQIPFTNEAGTTELLSAGQAFNKMMSSPDKEVRSQLFAAWEEAWSDKAPLLADTLNHLDGFRLSTYKLHGVADFLQEPLEYNRLQKTTLDTMWATVTNNKQRIMDYLTRKAQLFGKEKLDWQDQDAPIILGDLQEKTYTFDEAAAFITKHFANFSPKMAELAKIAFNNAWIEAEDRPGKRPGGYCSELPESQESRIFMTYSNSVNEVATLAHELGHAFHSSVLWDLPPINQNYAMNVAETASTFAELIVADATLKEATTVEEKINLLDTKLQNAVAMFMNIHARYIFEQNFYNARQNRFVAAEEISEMMLAAQKESYLNQLGSYHPHFWAAKLHFFIDDVPFYNFPYTFGYLFSMGIYAYANQHPGNFEDQYIALLRDTAVMTSEDLAKKHLNVDLTQPDFWQSAIDMVLADIDDFMELTAAFV